MSACNYVKHSSYPKSPQTCSCPQDRRHFAGHDITVDMWICQDCGAVHRVRAKEHDKATIQMDRKLKEALG